MVFFVILHTTRQWTQSGTLTPRRLASIHKFNLTIHFDCCNYEQPRNAVYLIRRLPTITPRVFFIITRIDFVETYPAPNKISLQ